MTNRKDEYDPFIERAHEEAQGVEIQSQPTEGGGLEQAREEAQGVEVFEDPDATVPAEILKEGSPGHEVFTEEALGLRTDEDEERVDEQSA
ncbi:MAG: hypothetical protein PVG83_02520 [Acidimicrobiia bacterium]|jgi:hypothetical protein